MVSLGNGTLSFKGSIPERSQSSSTDYGKNSLKNKLRQQLKKRRWEVKIKLSQFTPRKVEEELITPKVRILIIEIILERTYLDQDVIHVMRQVTLQKTVLRTRTTLIRRRGTNEDIMLMLQRMMNHPRRDPDMKVKILQARMNMF